MIKKVLAALGLTAAAGVPAIYAATRPQDTARGSSAAPVTSAQSETIICPLTGEEISPCCCPLNGKSK